MMKQAHRRIVASIGAESFESNVIERFGLVVTDSIILDVACEYGWQDSWMMAKSRSKAAAASPPNQNLQVMFNNIAKAAPPSVPAALQTPPPARPNGVVITPAPLAPVRPVAPPAARPSVPPAPLLDSPVVNAEAVAAIAAEMPVLEPEEQEDPNAPVCVICQDVMNRRSRNQSIFCGHTFHSYCLLEWRVQANKTDMECPFRCDYV